MTRQLGAAGTQFDSRNIEILRGELEKRPFAAAKIDKLAFPATAQGLRQHPTFCMRTKRPQDSRKKEHNGLALLSVLKFFGVFVRPIVFERLHVVGELGSQKDHATNQTFDNLPLIAPEQPFAVRAATQWAGAQGVARRLSCCVHFSYKGLLDVIMRALFGFRQESVS